MTALQKTAFIHAITTAFNTESFNICGLTNAYEVIGRNFFKSPLRSTFQALHCAKWAQLPVDTKPQMLVALFEDLGVNMCPAVAEIGKRFIGGV